MSTPQDWAGRAVESAHRAANAPLLVNAGGAVAVLALVPALVAPDAGTPGGRLLGPSLAAPSLLAWGTAASALLHILIYAVNRSDFEASRGRERPWLHGVLFWTAILTASMALACFVTAVQTIAWVNL